MCFSTIYKKTWCQMCFSTINMKNMVSDVIFNFFDLIGVAGRNIVENTETKSKQAGRKRTSKVI